DNASLHHSTSAPEPEDEFEQLFTQAMKGDAAILRGRFGSFAHDKVLIVSNNFSVTGFYVNSNHVLVYEDPKVAATYAEVFKQAWNDGAKKDKFQQSRWSTEVFEFKAQSTSITFAPHDTTTVAKILGDVAKRIK